MQAAVSFHNLRHPAERAEAQINAFQTPPAVKTTMIYTHVLNRGPAGVLDRAQPTEDKGINATLAAIPAACYTGRKPELRILCGSV